MTLHELYRFVINIIYPNICPCCEEIIDWDEDFCDRCRKKFMMCNEEFHIDNVDRFVAYCYYEGKIRYAIRKFKITSIGNSYYAFAFGIVQALRRKELTKGIDGVVYIPMTRIAEENRGYNQVELIAREVHHLLNIPVLSALVKTRATRSQKSLNAKARKINIKGAFFANTEIDIKGKRLLLIDDLCTTGNTLAEAARILKDAGAVEIIAATFAKTKDVENKKLDL